MSLYVLKNSDFSELIRYSINIFYNSRNNHIAANKSFTIRNSVLCGNELNGAETIGRPDSGRVDETSANVILVLLTGIFTIIASFGSQIIISRHKKNEFIKGKEWNILLNLIVLHQD